MATEDPQKREILTYLKSVLEGEDGIEPWRSWFGRNDATLRRELKRTEYLRLKRDRIKAIPAILGRFDISFVPSERYGWLSGVEGRCRDCGASVVDIRGRHAVRYCPKGCFKLHSFMPQERNV